VWKKRLKKISNSRARTAILLLAVVFFLLDTVFQQTASCVAEIPAEIGIVNLDTTDRSEAAVEIILSNNSSVLAAGLLELTYNPEFFSVKNVSQGTLLNDVLFESSLNEAGIIKIAWIDPMDAGKEGVNDLLSGITFLRKKEQPLILNFQKIEMIRTDGTLIPVRVKGEETDKPSHPTGEIRLQLETAKACVNGSAVSLYAAPFLQNKRTMVPVRFISEQLGAKVSWLQEKSQVRIEDGPKTIMLTINSSSALVNELEKELDSAAVMVNGTVFVPLRFVSTILGADVTWNEADRSITISCF